MSVVFKTWWWKTQEPELRQRLKSEDWLYIEDIARQAWDYAIENAAVEAHFQLREQGDLGMTVAGEIRGWKTENTTETAELRFCIFCGKQPEFSQDETELWFGSCGDRDCPGNAYFAVGPEETREDIVMEWQAQAL